jgi:glycosyltransferase involved in cell wall biosynthesis
MTAVPAPTADRASLRVCALIPAFDEADAIGAVVAGAAALVNRIIVIDDGSSDGTGDRAREAGATIVRLDRRGGKGRALREGLARAFEGDFTHVLFMDGDGQHRPEDIRALTRVACDTGADLVIGCRMFHRQVMPRSRHFSNTVGSRLASRLVGQPVRDSQSGFRLARLASLRKLALRSTRYEFEMEVLIKMSRAGCRIAQAPISTVYDGHTPRSKMKPIRDTIRICLWSLWFRFAAR